MRYRPMSVSYTHLDVYKRQVQGYGMAAKSFSTEYGRQCIWLEDIYIKAEYRGLGIGSQFIDYITKKYPDALLLSLIHI